MNYSIILKGEEIEQVFLEIHEYVMSTALNQAIRPTRLNMLVKHHFDVDIRKLVDAKAINSRVNSFLAVLGIIQSNLVLRDNKNSIIYQCKFCENTIELEVAKSKLAEMFALLMLKQSIEENNSDTQSKTSLKNIAVVERNKKMTIKTLLNLCLQYDLKIELNQEY